MYGKNVAKDIRSRTIEAFAANQTRFLCRCLPNEFRSGTTLVFHLHVFIHTKHTYYKHTIFFHSVLQEKNEKTYNYFWPAHVIYDKMKKKHHHTRISRQSYLTLHIHTPIVYRVHLVIKSVESVFRKKSYYAPNEEKKFEPNGSRWLHANSFLP